MLRPLCTRAADTKWRQIEIYCNCLSKHVWYLIYNTHVFFSVFLHLSFKSLSSVFCKPLESICCSVQTVMKPTDGGQTTWLRQQHVKHTHLMTVCFWHTLFSVWECPNLLDFSQIHTGKWLTLWITAATALLLLILAVHCNVLQADSFKANISYSTSGTSQTPLWIFSHLNTTLCAQNISNSTSEQNFIYLLFFFQCCQVIKWHIVCNSCPE